MAFWKLMVRLLYSWLCSFAITAHLGREPIEMFLQGKTQTSYEYLMQWEKTGQPRGGEEKRKENVNESAAWDEIVTK